MTTLVAIKRGANSYYGGPLYMHFTASDKVGAVTRAYYLRIISGPHNYPMVWVEDAHHPARRA